LDGTNSPPTYLVSKLALLFVAILKRTWLSSWDDPLPIIIELYNRSVDSRLLVLQVLRYTVEDVCLSPEEPLPQKRKKLLSQMLTVTCNSEKTLREIYPEGVEWLETLPGWTKWGVPGQLGLLGLVSSTIIERTTEVLATSGGVTGGNIDGKVVKELLASIKFLQVCIPWGPQR
jgi:Exportin 1-like protein